MSATVHTLLATHNEPALGSAWFWSSVHGFRVQEFASHTVDSSSSAQVSDALMACIVAMRQGNERALEQLYDATVGKLYALAMAILKSPEEAEEIVCSTYAWVWANAAGFDPARGPVLGWLVTVCRSRCLDRLRQLKTRGIQVDIDAIADLASPDEQPDDLLSLLQNHSRIHAAMAKLTELRRQLVGMAFLQGLTHQEIAARTGMALGTVKSHVRRALVQLREELTSS